MILIHQNASPMSTITPLFGWCFSLGVEFHAVGVFSGFRAGRGWPEKLEDSREKSPRKEVLRASRLRQSEKP